MLRMSVVISSVLTAGGKLIDVDITLRHRVYQRKQFLPYRIVFVFSFHYILAIRFYNVVYLLQAFATVPMPLNVDWLRFWASLKWLLAWRTLTYEINTAVAWCISKVNATVDGGQRSKCLAVQYDTHTTQAKQLHHFSIQSPFTSAQLWYWPKRSLIPVK